MKRVFNKKSQLLNKTTSVRSLKTKVIQLSRKLVFMENHIDEQ